ncbi:MAG: universal stress protein [Gammaproteobacteria bacterium]|nr:universal stress protein [Gammaproteobacteria bacterium]
MFHRILVAVDGSDSALKAFEAAVDLARKYGSTLAVLAVSRPPEFAEDVETEAILEHSQSYYQGVLDALRARADTGDLVIRYEVAVGHPAEKILACAENDRIDLIVVGHRGKSFLQRWLVGSVTKHVINHAHCAVLVVR